MADSNPPEYLLTLSDLTQKDRIQILLSEYSTLRSEILSRTGYGFNLAAIGAALITWLVTGLSQQPWGSRSWRFWTVIGAMVIAFLIMTWANVRDLKRAAFRVKELEHEINSRAGEHLLTWETLAGVMTRMGLIRSFFSRVKPYPRDHLPSLERSYLEKEARRTNK